MARFCLCGMLMESCLLQAAVALSSLSVPDPRGTAQNGQQ